MVNLSSERFAANFSAIQDWVPELSQFTPRLHLLDAIDSTNRALWHLIEQGAEEGTVVLASQQTQGRGQYGRQWVSPPGGVYLSVALTPNLAIEHGAQLTLCTAWGISIALRKFPGLLARGSNSVADILPVLIKWPNDLVLNRRKLGGILTETRLYGQLIHQAVVGVGINWANPVPVPGINLQEFLQSHSGIRIDSLERVAAITVAGVLMGYQRWQQIGIEKMLPDYVDLLINRGQAVDLRHRSGTIVGVTPAGNLQVQIASKQLSYPTNAALTGGSNFPETCRSELISLVPGEIDLGYDE